MISKSIKTGETINIRKMKLTDTDQLMNLKSAEGWNQTVEDWIFLINHPDSINLVAILNDQLIGSITAINYTNKVAWIGMMLIEQEQRGKGISKLLLNEAINSLSKCNSIKLDATPAGKPVYLKLGFVYEYTLYRMTNPSTQEIDDPDISIKTSKMTSDDLLQVIEFDEIAFGANRENLITYLYNNSPELAWIAKEDKKITGFCLGRKGTNYTQLGPVFATETKIAKKLIQSAINKTSGKAIVVDIHESKEDINKWLITNGFVTQRPFDRMYLTNNPHPGITEQQFLISGPELG